MSSSEFSDAAAGQHKPNHHITVNFEPVGPQDKALRIFGNSPVIPLIGIDRPELFEPLVRATIAGYEGTNHTPTIEILMRNEAAIPAGLAEVKKLKAAYGNAIHILIGSVIKSADVVSAYEAGADGIVSGGYSAFVALACHRRNLPYLPGLMTLEEVKNAVHAGYKIIKLFPANAPADSNAIKAPLSRLEMLKIYTAEDAQAPDDALNASTASEILAAVEQSEATAVMLYPANTSEELAYIHGYLASRGIQACCTGGVKANNIGMFAANSDVAGVGASFLVDDASKTRDFEKALTTALQKALVDFAAAKQPALRPEGVQPGTL